MQSLAKTKLESGLFTFYVGKENGKVLGYAAIETENVRTKPETLMIVLTPEGELRNVYMLAFHEPPEYMPPERWFDLLKNRPLAEMDFSTSEHQREHATAYVAAVLKEAFPIVQPQPN